MSRRWWQLAAVSFVVLITTTTGTYLRLRSVWLNEQRVVQDILAIGTAQRGYCGPKWIPQPLQSRLAAFDRVTAVGLEDQALPPEMLRDLGVLNSLRELRLTYAKGTGDVASSDRIDIDRRDREPQQIDAWNVGLEPLSRLINLERLELGGTPAGDVALQHLAGLSKLRDLGLSHTDIGNGGLKHLQKLSSLKKLNLRSTAIDDDGVDHLQGLTDLQTLILADTQITSVSLYYLQDMKELDYLDLAGTKVTDPGLRHLIKLPKLRILNLDSTKIHGEGFKHLQSLENLIVLRLVDTPLSPAGMTLLKDLSRLVILDLQGVSVSTDLRVALQDALPECKVYFSPASDPGE
ncbi:MAG: hypothetical protein JWP89_1439 [Schlesneria sp.]|nr:hypothetical protein [Schlesneria sp.]